MLQYFGLVGQNLYLSTKFMYGNVIFVWTTSNYSYYDVQLNRDTTKDPWTRVSDTQFTVRDALFYDSITINVRTPGSVVDNKETYNGTISFFLQLSYKVLKYNSMTFNASIFN